MSRKSRTSASATMLDLWRPPQGAGDPIGCLATTYTFAPGLFDEECLARFLEIESEPNRENLAFLLERECRLGSVYAGVVVDHVQAGVEHSLRWDVLPVRIRGGKQHAKVSVLAWSRHIRIIVASANLTEPGYRRNFEVAAAVDLKADEADLAVLEETTGFLRSLLRWVPALPSEVPPEVQRASAFLDQLGRRASSWTLPRKSAPIRQQLVFTLPAGGPGRAARSSMDEAIQACRGRGGLPGRVRVASPFFDFDEGTSRVTSALCKQMARGGSRAISFCVPTARGQEKGDIARLAAPRALLETASAHHAEATVEVLPEMDADKNPRPWHAKMMTLATDRYSALLIGSSNFTCAGMGVGPMRNAEANALTIADRVAYGREVGLLEAVWPEMEVVDDPESAEWLGRAAEEEEEATALAVPAGFLSATYCAGDTRQVVLRLDPEHLPDAWSVWATGVGGCELEDAAGWKGAGCESIVTVGWQPAQPPERILIRWPGGEAFLPLNVEDSRSLLPPPQLEGMSADDMLSILAASDPSAAFRIWAKRQEPTDSFDEDLDSATPADLDPLRRYDLHATFLHRIRRRAHVLAQLRANLQRPVWSRQALEWRLWGLVGVAPLAERLVRDLGAQNGAADEALMTLADFLIVLSEVGYVAADGALPKPEFDKVFRPFLADLADKLRRQVFDHRGRLAVEMLGFWERVVDRCLA